MNWQRVIGMVALLTGIVVAGDAAAQSRATGVVFDDANGNGVRDDGEEGISGVGVSNGRNVVATESDGSYAIRINEDDDIIFVIKPPDWQTPMEPDTNLPQFYYVHKPEGSPDQRYPGVEPTGPLPDSVDFPLVRNEEPNTFDVIVFGDPQPRNVEEVNYIAHDIVEELIGQEAAFGVTLGDIVFDDLDVFEPLNNVIGTIGAPWYNVLGNHDINFDTNDDSLSDETFESIYGPNYYAFNYGPVHFVVIDNVMWDGDNYHGEFGSEQLEFIENDLALVPEEKLVVFMMHIPLVNVDDRDKLFEIIENRPNTFSLSAHWHRQGHYSMGEEEGNESGSGHHHLVHGTVSGSWWSGQKDEFNIPHTMMRDGTPNGYSIATFRGKQYALRYKAARRPAEFQMSVYAPHAVNAETASTEEVIVNVFMGSEDTDVRMRLGEEGEWLPMTRQERPDPYYQKLKERERFLPPAAGRSLPSINDSTHIWTGNLPPNPPEGTHVVYIKATDTFGQTHGGKRIIRVE